MSNESKTVVITGASSGIGAALALRLGQEGHRLVLAARREKQLRQVAKEAEARGAAETCVFPADVTHREDVLRLRDTALDAFGGFDVWVNNAGRGITRPVLELRESELDEMIAVNVKSALYGMQAAVPYFIKRGGHGQIINVSSFLGRVPAASFRSAYSAAKAALNSLTTNLRMDLREEYPDIHVTLVMPGVVTTEFASNVVGEPRPPIVTAGQAQRPDEVAEIIARAIREPVAEVYTNPASSEAVRRFYADPASFRPPSGPARPELADARPSPSSSRPPAVNPERSSPRPSP